MMYMNHENRKCCVTCGRPLPEPPRTIADEIEEYRNMPPATRKLIQKLANAILESGQPVTIEC